MGAGGAPYPPCARRWRPTSRAIADAAKKNKPDHASPRSSCAPIRRRKIAHRAQLQAHAEEWEAMPRNPAVLRLTNSGHAEGRMVRPHVGPFRLRRRAAVTASAAQCCARRRARTCGSILASMTVARDYQYDNARLGKNFHATAGWAVAHTETRAATGADHLDDADHGVEGRGGRTTI